MQARARHTKIEYLGWLGGLNSGPMLEPCSAERTVVVVEDHASVRRAISNLLRSSGIHVLVYASAEELLSACEMPKTACLIIDVELSGMDGFDLHQRLISRGDRLPTIFISAAIDPAVSMRASSAGALAFLKKPFSEASLLVPIWRALGPVHAGVT
jgi:FixJ family two-component response regulator